MTGETLAVLARHPLVERTGWALVHSVWQCAAVAVILAIALAILPKRSARARYAGGCAALLLALAAPIVTFFLLAPAGAAPANASMGTFQSVELLSSPIISSELSPATPISSMETLRQALPWAVVVWMAGVLLISIREVGGWISVQQMRATARPIESRACALCLCRLVERLRIRRPILLAESARVLVPSMVGWLKPTILLPVGALSGLSIQHLEAILAHELAHVRRSDYLVNLIQSAVETLLFYHPAVWWISRQIRLERENCCDDLAVRLVGDVHVYSEALAAMEGIRSTGLHPAMAASGGSLLHRIRRLLKPEPRRAGFVWPMTIMAGLILAIATCGQFLTPSVKAQDQAAVRPPATAPTTSISVDVATEAQLKRAAERVDRLKDQLAQAQRQGGDDAASRLEYYQSELAAAEKELDAISAQQTRVAADPFNPPTTRWTENWTDKSNWSANTVRDTTQSDTRTRAEMQRLGERLADLRVQLAQASQNLAPNHPTVVALSQEIEILNAQAQAAEASSVKLEAQYRDRVAQANALTAEAQAKGASLNTEKDIRDRMLKVLAEESSRQSAGAYYITGTVKSGMFALDGKLNIEQAINDAGGLPPGSEQKYILIIRQAPEESGKRTQRLNVKDLKTSGPVPISAGDVILVTDRNTPPVSTEGRYRIDGAVPKPGYYPLVRNMTLLQALVAAGVNPAEKPDAIVEVHVENAARGAGPSGRPFRNPPSSVPMSDVITGRAGMNGVNLDSVITIREIAAQTQSPVQGFDVIPGPANPAWPGAPTVSDGTPAPDVAPSPSLSPAPPAAPAPAVR